MAQETAGSGKDSPPVVLTHATGWLWRQRDKLVWGAIGIVLGVLGAAATWLFGFAKWAIDDRGVAEVVARLGKDTQFIASVAELVPLPPQTLPVGAVVGWPSLQPIPDGWVECNGKPFSAASTDRIANLLVASGSGANVSVSPPNYAGFFLRGFDPECVVDAQRRDLGAVQTESIGCIPLGLADYGYRLTASDLVIKTESMPPSQVLAEPPENHDNSKRLAASKRFALQDARQAGIETRPINRSIRWIVRVR